MTNDRHRLVDYVLIVTMLCGVAATASGQGASTETERTSPAEAGAPAAILGAPAVADPEAETEAEEAGAAEEAETAEQEPGGRRRRARAPHRRAGRGDRTAAQRRGRAPRCRRSAAARPRPVGRSDLRHRPGRVHRRVRRGAARELRGQQRQDDAVRLSARHPLRRLPVQRQVPVQLGDRGRARQGDLRRVRLRRLPGDRELRAAGRHAPGADGAGQRVPRADGVHGGRAARHREQDHPVEVGARTAAASTAPSSRSRSGPTSSTASTGRPSRRAGCAAAVRRAARPSRRASPSPGGSTSRPRRASSSGRASTAAIRARARSSSTATSTASAPTSSTCTVRPRCGGSTCGRSWPAPPSPTRRCSTWRSARAAAAAWARGWPASTSRSATTCCPRFRRPERWA